MRNKVATHDTREMFSPAEFLQVDAWPFASNRLIIMRNDEADIADAIRVAPGDTLPSQ